MAILDVDRPTPELGAQFGAFPLSSRYTAGIAGERFLRGLKEGRILGSRSPDGHVHLPARTYCKFTFERTTEYVEVEGTPELYSYTVCREDLDGRRLDEPVVLGLARWPHPVRGGILHRILADPETVQIGMALRPVFRPEAERRGHILDLLGFEPV